MMIDSDYDTDFDATKRRPRRVRIDWTINVTTITAFVFSTLTGVGWVLNIQAQNDKRLALLEAAGISQRQTDFGQDAKLAQEMAIIRQSLQRIEDAQQRALERGLDGVRK